MSSYKNLPEHLHEAQRLLDQGLWLVEYVPNTKRPAGNGWNDEKNRAEAINPKATGYGFPLAENGFCSIDPDYYQRAKVGLEALGFDLEELMNAGVRTVSTRPNSGGRSTFRAAEGLRWLPFAHRDLGVALELRATSPNLQDAVPGVHYRDKQGGICTQRYAGEARLAPADQMPTLPDELLDKWSLWSRDKVALEEAKNTFWRAVCEAEGIDFDALAVCHEVSDDATGELRYTVTGITSEFNRHNRVEEILQRHDYKQDDTTGRYAPPSATGAPSVRPIEGKDDLWQSDHASDPLCGTFSAWVAHVVLDHGGDIDAAVSAYEEARWEIVVNDFEVLGPAVEGELNLLANVTLTNLFQSFVEIGLNSQPAPLEFVLDEVIDANGVSVIAGSPAVGKTSNLFPLALRVAHLVVDELTPEIRRKVIWVTEDESQVIRILNAMHARGEYASEATQAELSDYIKVLPATRMPANKWTLAKDVWSKPEFLVPNRCADGSIYEAKPWIVFDTLSASFAVDNENDNAELSRTISALKQSFRGFPVTLVAHISKSLKHADVASYSVRGASAIEGDANQLAYLVIRPDGTRWLELANAKRRFATDISGLLFNLQTHSYTETTRLGSTKQRQVVYGKPTKVTGDFKALLDSEAEARKAELEKTRLIDELATVARSMLDHGAGGREVSKEYFRNDTTIKTSRRKKELIWDLLVKRGFFIRYLSGKNKYVLNDQKNDFDFEALPELIKEAV